MTLKPGPMAYGSSANVLYTACNRNKKVYSIDLDGDGTLK